MSINRGRSLCRCLCNSQVGAAILFSAFACGIGPVQAVGYQAEELIVLFEGSAHSVIEATLTASRDNQTTIGVAEFDSIGAAHRLQSIQSSPQADVSEFSRRLYTLVFPDDSDIASIAVAYNQLPYVASAEVNSILRITSVLEDSAGAVAPRFTLEQNRPNPFNPMTVVQFTLSNSGVIELVIYDITGQKVSTLASGQRVAGTHVLKWDGRDDDGRKLASGIYVYQLVAGSGVFLVKKMLLLR